MEWLTVWLAQILSLCRKEFLAVIKDPANRTILFVPVLMQSVLFGYGATFDLTNVPYVVVDESRSATSTALLARIDGTGVFRRAATLETPAQIAAMIDAGKATVAITIPSDFDQRLTRGQASPVEVVLDGRNSSTAGAAAGQIGTIVADFNRSRGVHPAVTVERRAWYNPNLLTRWSLLPTLIASLSFMQTLLIAALSVAREREQGTFDQLMVTPLRPMQIMVGKLLPAMTIGLIQSTLVLLVIRFWFQIPMQGSLVLLYCCLIGFTTAAVGLGLSISALSLNMQQAMLYTFIVIMPMMLLSGMVTPVRNMPRVLQLATMVNPLRFGIDMARRIYLEGAGLSDIAFDFVPLAAITAVSLPLAAWLFRNRLS